MQTIYPWNCQCLFSWSHFLINITNLMCIHMFDHTYSFKLETDKRDWVKFSFQGLILFHFSLIHLYFFPKSGLNRNSSSWSTLWFPLASQNCLGFSEKNLPTKSSNLVVGGLGVVQPDPAVVVCAFCKYTYSSESNLLSEPNKSLGYRFFSTQCWSLNSSGVAHFCL